MQPLINWIQIPATNLDRAVTFYSAVLELEFIIEELNGIPHAVFQPKYGKSMINGAIIQVEDKPQAMAGPVLFFDATGKFAEMEKAIQENGGTLLKPKTLIKKIAEDGYAVLSKTYIDQNTGYFAQFLDSEGNRMALYGPY